MFFGLTNAPATFQSMMNFLFWELINEGYVTIYMDDILIHTPNDVALHWRVVNDVLRILANNDLYLKPQKCQFKVTKVEYLGVIISKDRIAMVSWFYLPLILFPCPSSLAYPITLFIFTFVAAILLLATLFAYLGSCAYPILSHLLLCCFPLRSPL